MKKTKKDTTRTKLKVLTGREQCELIKQPDTRYPIEHRNRVYLRLHLETGLRLREIMKLTWNRINLSTGTLYIKGIELNDRVLSLRGPVRKQLRAWKKRQAREWEKRQTQDSAPDDLPEYIFTNLNGSPITKRYIRNMVALQAEEAGINKRVTPSVLRHTFAVNLYLETGNLRLVHKALGYDDLSHERFYTKLALHRLDDVLDNIRQASVGSDGPEHLTKAPVYSGKRYGGGRMSGRFEDRVKGPQKELEKGVSE